MKEERRSISDDVGSGSESPMTAGSYSEEYNYVYGACQYVMDGKSINFVTGHCM